MSLLDSSCIELQLSPLDSAYIGMQLSPLDSANMEQQLSPLDLALCTDSSSQISGDSAFTTQTWKKSSKKSVLKCDNSIQSRLYLYIDLGC